jgi:protein-S-isoprenylcysteine O-methyltransferase Ste14
MVLRQLVGSGDRIALFTVPFVAVGVTLNVAFPSAFRVGGPSDPLRAVAIAVLVVGVIVWMWAVALVLTKVPRGELITSGPFRVMTHPIYTSVALLVIPWLGFLLDTWVGVICGIALYLGSRLFAPAEEAELAARFGANWDRYRDTVTFPWL